MDVYTAQTVARMIISLKQLCTKYGHDWRHWVLWDVCPHAVSYNLSPNMVMKVIAPVLVVNRYGLHGLIKPDVVLYSSTLHDPDLRQCVYNVLCSLYNAHPKYFLSDPRITINAREVFI